MIVVAVLSRPRAYDNDLSRRLTSYLSQLSQLSLPPTTVQHIKKPFRLRVRAVFGFGFRLRDRKKSGCEGSIEFGQTRRVPLCPLQQAPSASARRVAGLHPRDASEIEHPSDGFKHSNGFLAAQCFQLYRIDNYNDGRAHRHIDRGKLSRSLFPCVFGPRSLRFQLLTAFHERIPAAFLPQSRRQLAFGFASHRFIPFVVSHRSGLASPEPRPQAGGSGSDFPRRAGPLCSETAPKERRNNRPLNRPRPPAPPVTSPASRSP